MMRTMSKGAPLRIAQLHWGFPPVIGGVETHLTMLLPEMVRQGHTVYLLTGATEELSGWFDYQGVRLFRTPLMDLNWLYRRGLKGLEEGLREVFRNFFNQAKPDLIHVHNMHYFSELHARLLEEEAKRRKIPLVLTVHNVWDDLLFVDLTRNVKWNHIISVSHFIKRELIGIGVDDQRITVIHHGIDVERYHPNIST
ncbi:MAG: glycosyltransferase family 4 protein, partial [Candidatus Omnitrophota bacterium]